MLRIVEFGAVQGLVQLCTAIAGLVLVRTMAKEDYAQLAIVNSLITVGTLLSDVGVGLGLQSIGGQVWRDRVRFSALIATALHVRRRFAAISFVICVPLAGWMLWQNGATAVMVVGLTFCVIAGVVPLISTAMFTTSLQLHAETRRLQNVSLIGAVGRLVMIVGLAFSLLNAFTAALCSVIGNWFALLLARRAAWHLTEPAARPDPAMETELLRLSRKWMPNVIFFCFQGQITLLILTLVGNSSGIADLTALGRITALFALFSAIFSNLLSPRFARCQDVQRLPRLYVLLSGGSLLLLLPLVLLAWLSPDILLWLLGSKYSGMERAFIWVVGAGCITQVVSVLWTLNSSRAWIRLQSKAYIPVTLGVQLLLVGYLDLSQFDNLLVFNLATAAAPLPVLLLDGWVGLRSRPVLPADSAERLPDETPL